MFDIELLQRPLKKSIVTKIKELHNRNIIGGSVDLTSKNYILAAFDDGDFAGFATVSKCPLFSQWAYMDRCVVGEDFRGNGLQGRFLEAREAVAKREWDSVGIWTYTDSENAASMNSLIKAGYRPFENSEVRRWVGESRFVTFSKRFPRSNDL